MPEVKIGIPSVVEAALLPGLFGQGRARRLLLTGETIGAAEALGWGLVYAVVAVGGLDEAVERLIRPILAAGPQGIRLQKALLLNWEELPIGAAKKGWIDWGSGAPCSPTWFPRPPRPADNDHETSPQAAARGRAPGRHPA